MLKKSSLAPAVDRAYSILFLLSKNNGAPLSLTEISAELSIAKSSISNICGSLENSGLIEKKGNGYRLGRQVLLLAGSYLSSFNQVSEFYQLCLDSPLLRNEIVQMAILDGTDVFYIAKHVGCTSLRYSAETGDRLPAALTALGNVLLAQLDDAYLTMLYKNNLVMPRFTNKSVSSFNELQRKIEDTRQRGYALDRGEVFPNVTGVAVAIPAWRPGGDNLAIGVSMIDIDPMTEQNQPHRVAILEALNVIADKLSNPLLKK